MAKHSRNFLKLSFLFLGSIVGGRVFSKMTSEKPQGSELLYFLERLENRGYKNICFIGNFPNSVIKSCLCAFNNWRQDFDLYYLCGTHVNRFDSPVVEGITVIENDQLEVVLKQNTLSIIYEPPKQKVLTERVMNNVLSMSKSTIIATDSDRLIEGSLFQPICSSMRGSLMTIGSRGIVISTMKGRGNEI